MNSRAFIFNGDISPKSLPLAHDGLYLAREVLAVETELVQGGESFHQLFRLRPGGQLNTKLFHVLS